MYKYSGYDIQVFLEISKKKKSISQKCHNLEFHEERVFPWLTSFCSAKNNSAKTRMHSVVRNRQSEKVPLMHERDVALLIELFF